MGTTGIVRVFDDSGTAELVRIYKQADGYPESLGADILSFLKARTLQSGIGDYGAFNTMQDCAARLVAFLKNEMWQRDLEFMQSESAQALAVGPLDYTHHTWIDIVKQARSKGRRVIHGEALAGQVYLQPCAKPFQIEDWSPCYLYEVRPSEYWSRMWNNPKPHADTRDDKLGPVIVTAYEHFNKETKMLDIRAEIRKAQAARRARIKAIDKAA